jgi:hypothetical protein
LSFNQLLFYCCFHYAAGIIRLNLRPYTMQNRKAIIEIISALFILLWVYAALSKLMDYPNFKVQLGKSPLINSFAPVVSVAIPTMEFGFAALLLFDRTKKIGLYASLFLMVMFTAYLIAILNFSYYIPCSCGGIIGKGLGWKAHIIFNLVFVALGLFAVFIYRNKNQKQTSQHSQPAIN